MLLKEIKNLISELGLNNLARKAIRMIRRQEPQRTVNPLEELEELRMIDKCTDWV